MFEKPRTFSPPIVTIVAFLGSIQNEKNTKNGRQAKSSRKRGSHVGAFHIDEMVLATSMALR